LELQNSENQTLIDLGLTLLQARVYLALIRSGPSKVATISKLANVARPDAYRTLAKLQQLGLVEKLIEKPIRYRAISMKKSLTFLLRSKAEEYKKLRAETELLLKTYKEKDAKKVLQTEADRFVLIPKRRAVIERIREAIEGSQRSVDLILSWKRFSRGMLSTFAESCERAWARGVKFRFVLEKPEEGKAAEHVLQICRKSPACQIKFIPTHPKTVLGIYDEKEVFVIVNPKMELADSPALWSNNQSLIHLAQNYFEVLWTTSMKKLTAKPTMQQFGHNKKERKKSPKPVVMKPSPFFLNLFWLAG